MELLRYYIVLHLTTQNSAGKPLMTRNGCIIWFFVVVFLFQYSNTTFCHYTKPLSIDLHCYYISTVVIKKNYVSEIRKRSC